MKLYADEDGRHEVLSLGLLVVSALARVEVPSALWRKHRAGEITLGVAATLVASFEDDYLGSGNNDPRFVSIEVSNAILASAARLTATARLRSFDAVQLASAEGARLADPSCDTFACFDGSLREAAATMGFALYPG